MPRNRKTSSSGPPAAGSSSNSASGSSSNASSGAASPARGRGRGAQRRRGGCFTPGGPSARGRLARGRGNGRGRGRGSNSAGSSSPASSSSSSSRQNAGRGHRRSSSLFTPTSLPEAFRDLGVENPPAWSVGVSTMSELADLTALFFSNAEDIFRSARQADSSEATTETVLSTQTQAALRQLQQRLDDDSGAATPGEGSSGQSSPAAQQPRPYQLNPRPSSRPRRYSAPLRPLTDRELMPPPSEIPASRSRPSSSSSSQPRPLSRAPRPEASPSPVSPRRPSPLGSFAFRPRHGPDLSTRRLPPLRGPLPFWGPQTTVLVPCDDAGTIRDAYKRARIEDMQRLRAGGNPFAYWTVAHTQQVCIDVHRMPPADRAGFGDLHKQMRELYFFHHHISQLFPSPGVAMPLDLVPVELEGNTMGPDQKITRVLRDFIQGMNEHLLARWRPFSRVRPEWNVDTVYLFFEDFSCFLMHHDKFRGQDVLLMQAPQAADWAAQGALRFRDAAVPFRGFRERLETGLREGEESWPSSEESNSDRADEDWTPEQRDEAREARKRSVDGSGSA